MSKGRIAILLVALLGFSALATNGLLALHRLTCLEACHHDETDRSEPQRPLHDSNHCPVCQVLLKGTDQYISETAPLVTVSTACESMRPMPQSVILSSPLLPSLTHRGPPA